MLYVKIYYIWYILSRENTSMKRIKVLFAALIMLPMAAFGASDFTVAAQLLAAAKNADIQQVQILINNGADVNYVDSTGLSLVCTALMNNDLRAAQILQMYGADASKCDRQIKKYNNNNRPVENSGGLFSGLSSTQTIALAAAGAAVVVGGLLLLTDVFDPGNDNNNPSGGGSRPGGDPDPIVPIAKEKFTLPYGPAMPDKQSELDDYINNLNVYSPSIDNIYSRNFKLMTNGTTQNPAQNYLLMMHGYSPLARGYLGARTLRYESNAPVPNSVLGKINIKGEIVGGGRPVNVALVTANGINATPKPAGAISAEKNSLDDKLLAWTSISGNQLNLAPEIGNLSSKYFNNKIILGGDGAELTNSYTVEDGDLVGAFDLTGFGTAINNANASNLDNQLAKILGGNPSGYANADYIGFIPNGQMTIFRSGDGTGMIDVAAADAINGTYTGPGNKPETITFNGKTYTLVHTGTTFVATENVATGETPTVLNGYMGANGMMYMASVNGSNTIDMAFNLATAGIMTQKLKRGEIDYMNYTALLRAKTLSTDLAGGRSRVGVIANGNVIGKLHSRDAATIDTILSGASNNYQTSFLNLVNEYYQNPNADHSGTSYTSPSDAAQAFFGGIWSADSTPLTIFSTGAFETDQNYSGPTLTASFENAAPLVFGNKLSHLFASVVAVGLTGSGTNDQSNVSGYSTSNKIAISQWRDMNGTPSDPDDDKYYKARICGVAGTGTGAIDPWCFAAAGITDEMAVSSMAGAAGALRSAFDYMNTDQIFVLMALTADGPFLATTTNGTAMTRDDLIAHLQSMYLLPNEYQAAVTNGTKTYLDAFREVFGYGLINLERATKPNTKIYFYDGSANRIVSANGNAYWRAASNTVFRASSAFAPRTATISAPFFDILESVDGDMSMPRIWQNEFAIGTTDARGLYMGDVLGEMRVRDDQNRIARTQIGNMEFAIGMSDRRGDDNLNGLDTMRLDYAHGNVHLGAGFQRNFTDGAARFDDRTNPVLNLASNVLTSDAAYNYGNWTFGARAFSGAITDEGLLENDPTVAANFEPGQLGLAHGGQISVSHTRDNLRLDLMTGVLRESNTILGAQTGGLLSLGGGDTMYINATAQYDLGSDLTLYARSTFARTTGDANGDFIMGLSSIDSNSFAIGADVGPVTLTLARPLGVTRGHMQYAHAEYDVVQNADGKYELNVVDTHVADLNLSPRHRELRLMAEYRRPLGKFTDGAFGMIYRIHPNNTDEFGNESIFMMKFSHRVGI